MSAHDDIGFRQKIMDIIHSDDLTVKQILDKNGKSTFGLLLVVLSIPSALPIPAPGYSTPFGVVLLLLGIQIILSKHIPWVPKKLLEKKIHLKLSAKIEKGLLWFLGVMEKVIHTRLSFLSHAPWYQLTGILIVLCGASMILPIPLTNTVPAMGIFLIGVGMIEKDGLILLG